MSTVVETPNKITDFFPPSPALVNGTTKGTEDQKETKRDADDVIKTLDLSNSSVVLTPEASPVKADEEGTSGSRDAASASPCQSPDTTQPRTKPACKKGLSEELKDSKQPSQPCKTTRRGRRKKNSPRTEQQTTKAEPQSETKAKAARKKKTETDGLRNTLLTDFFPVRRSDRRCKTDLQKEKEVDLEHKLLNQVEDGLKVEEIDNKGRGVVATKCFLRGDFVVEYAGDLIDIPTAKERDEKYSRDSSAGCYMYYFNFKNKKYCIDATAESGRLGRLLNHSKTAGNCHTKLVEVKGRPYLILVASKDISIGEELQYDYGDRSKASLESHPWLKS